MILHVSGDAASDISDGYDGTDQSSATVSGKIWFVGYYLILKTMCLSKYSSLDELQAVQFHYFVDWKSSFESVWSYGLDCQELPMLLLN